MHLATVDSSVGTVFGYVSSDTDNPFVLSGTYFEIGTSIYMNMVCTQTHKGTSARWKDSGVMQIVLDASTLNGTLYEISNDYNTVLDSFDQGYSKGTLTLTKCP